MQLLHTRRQHQAVGTSELDHLPAAEACVQQAHSPLYKANHLTLNLFSYQVFILSLLFVTTSSQDLCTFVHSAFHLLFFYGKAVYLLALLCDQIVLSKTATHPSIPPIFIKHGLCARSSSRY